MPRLSHLSHLSRRLRRSLLRRRRPLAALCAAVAVAAGLQANSAPPPPRTMVLTAAHDLPAGVVVHRDDLSLTAFDPDSVPGGILGARTVVGRTTTVPLHTGEPMTAARVMARSLLEDYPGLAAVPVRIGDPGVVRLLRVGDRVDLLAADPQGDQPAETIGHDVPLLAIPRVREQSPGLTNGALVLVGLPDDAARTVAQASVSRFLSVVLTR